MREANDGTVTLVSELRADIQALATRGIGVDVDHNGIINSEETAVAFNAILAAIARE